MTLRTLTLFAAVILSTVAVAHSAAHSTPTVKKHPHKAAPVIMTPVQSATTAMTGGQPYKTSAFAPSTKPIAGGVAANKNTHVYHQSGDKWNLLGEKNRVYFATEVAARAAGYHPAGSAHKASGVSAKPGKETAKP